MFPVFSHLIQLVVGKRETYQGEGGGRLLLSIFLGLSGLRVVRADRLAVLLGMGFNRYFELV